MKTNRMNTEGSRDIVEMNSSSRSGLPTSQPPFPTVGLNSPPPPPPLAPVGLFPGTTSSFATRVMNSPVQLQRNRGLTPAPFMSDQPSNYMASSSSSTLPNAHVGSSPSSSTPVPPLQSSTFSVSTTLIPAPALISSEGRLVPAATATAVVAESREEVDIGVDDEGDDGLPTYASAVAGTGPIAPFIAPAPVFMAAPPSTVTHGHVSIVIPTS